VVADPDRDRREAFLSRACPHLAAGCGLPGLPRPVVQQLSVGDVVVCWSAAAHVPIAVHRTADGVAVLWGDALRPGDTRRIDAQALWEAWTAPAPPPPPFDGFHAGVVVRGEEVLVGGDLLGLFPVYHAAPRDVQLAGSSAAALHLHPALGRGLDVEAMLGYLLIGGPFDGRTLRAGVRRLPAAARLRWGRGAVHEEVTYRLPSGDAPARGEAEDAARLGAALDQAVRRHAGLHRRLALLLSGGRDSRLIAGCGARAGREVHAVSLGRRDDYDASCATRVARALGMRHGVRDIAFSDYPRFADASVGAEQLAGGMSNVHAWGNGAALHAEVGATDGVLAGYLMEVRQLAPLAPGLDAVLRWSHAHALAPEQVRALLRRGALHDHLDAVCAAIAACADAHDGRRDGWRWLLGSYGRFHAGAIPWRLSFAAWPVLPILDRELLATLFTLPAASLANRALQERLLREQFPALARLPLDRNAHDTRPLVPSWRHRLRWIARRWRPRASPAVERRYYARMYDFDNPGWRAIRRDAEAGREALAAWFAPEALDALVPAPDRPAAHRDPIADGFGPRMLTGLMRWCTTGAERDA